MKIKGLMKKVETIYSILGIKAARKYKNKHRKEIDYGLEPLTSDEAINILIDYLLGPNWYVSDPLGKDEIIAIAVDDIIKKYKGF